MIDVGTGTCEAFQRVAAAWLRSGEMTRTNHLLSPLEELAGYNYGFVYLLELSDAETQTVKIGFSEHPMRRIREIKANFRYGTNLRLRACFVGEQSVERELHRRFRHLRIHNERFLASGAIDATFADEREKVRERLTRLHLCGPECEQIVKNLDLRMLAAWLRRGSRGSA
ncbi:MAG TPA: GIY-YIG nuclease family protein [Candidatus Aquilonibacter sp.]|nr:GIY-YIG nuclease family protein [Candidatus Aquilonibacter sp.]